MAILVILFSAVLVLSCGQRDRQNHIGLDCTRTTASQDQCSARYYLEDGIFILKIQDSILSYVFKVLLKSILTKRNIRFEDTFHKIRFVHCVCIYYMMHRMIIILEHKSSKMIVSQFNKYMQE